MRPHHPTTDAVGVGRGLGTTRAQRPLGAHPPCSDGALRALRAARSARLLGLSRAGKLTA